MKNKYILWFAISMVIMLIVPWLAISFVNGDAGMAVCFILFFAIDPIYSREATSQARACSHLATAARVKYPAPLGRTC